MNAIGQSRRRSGVNKSNATIAKLVMKDTYSAYRALKGKKLDLVLTCGNAGDVRKGISAAKKLDIPRLHMEQDIYNPIEMIAYADLITVPSNGYKKKLKKLYGIENTVNIKGYPQAEYVLRHILKDPDDLYRHYGISDFYVLFLGGDTRPEDIPEMIRQVEMLSHNVLVIPYRFDVAYVSKFITKKGVYIIDGDVDLISLMNASDGVIYCSGMGVTIEVGALSVPAVKVLGFHKEHASNDLALSIGINVVSIYEIHNAVEHMKTPFGSRLVKNGSKASYKVAELAKNMDMFGGNSGGLSSLRKIWNQRKKYK
jgi:UDP-N-acetylglucosamine:LPS N-acetylglucosamine transferase